MSGQGYAGEILPAQAWQILQTDAKAVLIDVRTPAEWAYVGIPDLSALGKQALFIPWQLFPDMKQNPYFVEQVRDGGVGPDGTVLLLCRSGVRSRAAAIALTALGFKTCYNISSGFEGNHDAHRHRGTVSGWKVDGLPWIQS
jgi:rhodanese-related sulfurtransferase